MTTNTQPRRSFGRRLWWVLRTTILALLVIALGAVILGALGYGGYQGVIEIQRSFDSLTTRVAANEQNVESLTQFVDEHVISGNADLEREVDALTADVSLLQRQLAALQTDLAADVAAQELALQDLEDGMATAVAQNNSAAADVDTLQTALVALQNDININSNRIDDVGGEVDELENDLETVTLELSESAAAVTSITSSLVATDTVTLDYNRALQLFRVWNLTTQARFQLLTGEEDEALVAIELAQEGLRRYLEGSTDDVPESLLTVRTRLELAADSLVTDGETALNDLVAAWNGLDAVLAPMLGVTEAVEAVLDTPTATTAPAENATPAPTVEQTPIAVTAVSTAVPAATVTPTP